MRNAAVLIVVALAVPACARSGQTPDALRAARRAFAVKLAGASACSEHATARSRRLIDVRLVRRQSEGRRRLESSPRVCALSAGRAEVFLSGNGLQARVSVASGARDSIALDAQMVARSGDIVANRVELPRSCAAHPQRCAMTLRLPTATDGSTREWILVTRVRPSR